MGELQQVKGTMPHPDGDISVSLQRKGGKGVAAEIILPPNLTGTFIWEGRSINLKGGVQRIKL
jgi:hypothetical protein